MSELVQLEDARARLKGCKKNLQALASSSPGSEEFSKAKLHVAEAQLDVAEEELDEAEEKLHVAKAKEDTPEQQSVIAKAEVGVAKAEVGVAEAKVGVAKAEWDVAIAVYNAEAKTSNTERLGFLQGQIEDRKEVYKRLQGRVSSLHFRAPHVSRVAFLLTVIELARLCVQILLFA